MGEPQKLLPLFDGVSQSLETWHEIRGELKSIWEDTIGHPSFTGIVDIKSEADLLESFEHPEYNGKIYCQPTCPETKQTILLMEPKDAAVGPRPGALVPYYHPDAMAGFDLTLRQPINERPNIQFGLHLVRQGYVVLCCEAFPFNTVPEPVDNKDFAWWQAAADKIKRDHPRWTGIGKLIWDTRRAVDFLSSRKNVDTERIAVIGHSLGGKMAFCTAAFDDRIKAVIASDFGIGWDFTNWDADWYYGNRIYREGFNQANHQLLAMIAPRPFLLLGGQYDKPESWQYINEAKKVYKLYGKETSIGFLDHASGHYPPQYAVDVAYRWLAERFNLQYREWRNHNCE